MGVRGLWLDCHFLVGGKEPRNETVTGRVTLNVVGVDVERERNDSVTVNN
jgi:hypothetical protein